MTTRTGGTPMTLATTFKPPPKVAIFGGCAIQIATLAIVWTQLSPLRGCLMDRTKCWDDPWSRIVLIHLSVIMIVWCSSLRTIPTTGTSDPSIVDRLWSNLPYLYTIALAVGWPSPRLWIMAACSSAWGVRLTANFITKGGFSGGEDYRWAEVRTWFEGEPWFFSFESFNFFFVVGFQLLVVLAFTSPAALAAYSERPLGTLDTLATVAFLSFFAIETVADWQMYTFQTEKYRRKAAGEAAGEYAKGFIDTGLWSYSRHPNYFGELGMWWSYYLLGVAASGEWVNWSITGSIFLNLLFLPPGASLDLTEMLSSRKYAAYPEYQARVSRFFPWWPKKKGSVGQL